MGNARDAADPDTLRALGVNRVLNVTASPGALPPSLGDGVTCRHLPAADTGHQNLKQYFDTAFQFIGEYHTTLSFGHYSHSVVRFRMQRQLGFTVHIVV